MVQIGTFIVRRYAWPCPHSLYTLCDLGSWFKATTFIIDRTWEKEFHVERVKLYSFKHSIQTRDGEQTCESIWLPKVFEVHSKASTDKPFWQSVKKIFNVKINITFTALKVLLEPDLVLTARVSLLSSPNILHIHSFSSLLTSKIRLCNGLNLKMAYTSAFWWIPAKKCDKNRIYRKHWHVI